MFFFWSLEPVIFVLSCNTKRILQKWWRFWDKEIILFYPGGANLIPGTHESKEPLPKDVAREGVVTREERPKEMRCCWLWSWKRGPGGEECRWSLAAGRGRETAPPLGLPERNETLLISSFLAQWDQLSDLGYQNYKLRHFCLLKPLNLWWPVMTEIENKHRRHWLCSHLGLYI